MVLQGKILVNQISRGRLFEQTIESVTMPLSLFQLSSICRI